MKIFARLLLIVSVIGFSALISQPASAAGTSGTAALTWGAVTLDSTGQPLPAGNVTYNIYAGQSSASLVVVKSGLSVLSFTFTGLTDGVTYYYAVSATFAGNEGAKSPIVSKKMPIPLIIPCPVPTLTIQ